jgi:hypothetical protein
MMQLRSAEHKRTLYGDTRDIIEVIMARTLLVVIVIILLLGALPAWPYSAGWGYYPAGGLGGILLLLIILALVGVI